MKAIAIIPARGHSKGILRKNLQYLNGKPLIAHSIDAALASQRIDRVVVSTDDPEIKAVSLQFGADVVERPAAISGDTSSSESALLQVLDKLEKKENYAPAITVFLQCTSPLTLSSDIDKCIEALIQNDADTALTVTDFHYFIWQYDNDSEAVGINHDKRVRFMRQQRDSQFLETGAVYAMRTDGFKLHKHRFFGKTAMSVMPVERCLEIDEPIHLKIAEVMLLEREGYRIQAKLPENIEALVMDFDGVFTDNRVTVSQSGAESVACSRSDGMGLARLRNLGLKMIVLSSEQNPVVRSRCQKLKLDCLQGLEDKKAALQSWIKQNGLNKDNVIFLGNDTNDSECLMEAGCGVVVQDAHPDVKKLARIILTRSGGDGAVRELTDQIELKLKDKKNGQRN